MVRSHTLAHPRDRGAGRAPVSPYAHPLAQRTRGGRAEGYAEGKGQREKESKGEKERKRGRKVATKVAEVTPEVWRGSRGYVEGYDLDGRRLFDIELRSR